MFLATLEVLRRFSVSWCWGERKLEEMVDFLRVFLRGSYSWSVLR
jgi:hypothetical protein